MRIRPTAPDAARGAWLTAGRATAGALLVGVAVSACGGGGPASTYTPVPQVNGTSAASAVQSVIAGATATQSHQVIVGGNGGTTSGSAAASAHASAVSSSAAASASASRSAASSASASRGATTVSPSASASARTSSAAPAPAHTTYPTAAPETGGGGTAGLQDGLLFGVGGLAVFAGAGSLALRRRLARKVAARESASRDRTPAH